MPHYKKVFDIGTYTGNGGQYRVGIPTLRSVGPTGTQIAGSTRFRFSNSVYLSRTPASAGNRTTWTFSCWIKRGLIGTGTAYGIWGSTGAGTTECVIYFLNDGIRFTQRNGAGVDWNLFTTQILSDTSLWYHIVIVLNTTSATSSSRAQIYVNGVLQSLSTATYPSQNYSATINNNIAHTIGTVDWGSTRAYYSDYYMSQVYFVDGQALTPSSFGEYNSDGIWVAKAYSGTYGTNGFYLPMNTSANYATDQSGNGNNWTPTGFNTSTANTTYDLMTDSPTDYLSGSMSTANNAGNYASLSPYNKSSILTLSNGNLYFTGGSSVGGDTFSQIAVNMNLPTTGKWYFEMQPQSTGSDANTFGFNITRRNRDGNGWPATRNNPGYPGYYSFEYGLYLGGGLASDTLAFRNNYVTNATTTTVATGVVTNVYTAWYGVAIDCDSSTFQMYRNGVALGTASSFIHPGTDAFITLMKGDFAMAANFGQQPFGYGVPSGYKALNTYNIPRPADSSLWFYGDTPDFIWIKTRTTSGRSHSLNDTVRGPGLDLFSESASAELGNCVVSEFNKFGMNVLLAGGNYRTNASAENYVYWAWKAGSNTSSSSVTNTDGTITSQVSANRQAGFSIVSYTLNNSTFTVGHGLGAAPNFIMVKNRDTTNNWDVYHSSVGAGYRLILNAGDAASSSTQVWNNTSPTSSVFSGNSAWWSSPSTSKMIAYCWTAIPGYSSFGSWTGNGSTDGPFIYLGFKPKFVFYKRSDAAGNDWTIHDATRDYYNGYSVELYPSLSNAEGGPYSPPVFDFLSNGLKIRSATASYTNTNGGTYIYAAFAETPFKFARAR